MASRSELDALLSEAMNAHQSGRIADAQKLYKALLKQAPAHFPALHFLGLSYFQQGQHDKGIKFIEQALAIKPDYAEAHYNLATALHGIGRLDQAIAHYEKTLAIDPNNPDAHNNLGAVLLARKHYDQAIAHFQKALAINPNYASAHSNLGTAFKDLQRYTDAVAHFERALSFDRGNIEIWCNLGAALLELKCNQQALAIYQQAAALAPGFAEADLGRGNALSKLDRFEEAVAAFERALEKEPDLAEAWLGLGHVRSALKQYDKAVTAYDKALQQKPQLDFVLGYRLHAMMHNCDWSGFEVNRAQLIDGINNDRRVTIPFLILGVSSSPAIAQKCAQIYVENKCRQSEVPLWNGQRYSHERIRIGYLSADFRNHAIAQLVAGVFEHHDKSRFEIIGLSSGRNDESAMRERIKRAFDDFIDVSTNTDFEIAKRVFETEIDILVDLTGFTEGERVNVHAMRPAPLQINYLGYAGTLGAPYVDYIIADKILIPEDEHQYYSEKVAYLPHCYHPNDRSRLISDVTPTRKALGLSEDSFVFCSFNNSYKITPDMFDVWMRLLRGVDNSLLWLLESSDLCSANLRNEAQRRGVAADRIVFAPRIGIKDHLARHRRADLFLDTLPYNAHATAVDALWAGLPVATCLGSAFPGRVAASLLKAIGLPEMITHSFDEYETLILRLVRDPMSLASVKAKLASNCLTYPLFDIARWTRGLEKVYLTMWERQRNGLPPASFELSPDDVV